MSKTITIEDDVYDLLASLKEDSRDSFTRVIRRYLPRPCETAGELLDVYEHAPLPKVNWDVLDQITAGRGRRSGGCSQVGQRVPPACRGKGTLKSSNWESRNQKSLNQTLTN